MSLCDWERGRPDSLGIGPAVRAQQAGRGREPGMALAYSRGPNAGGGCYALIRRCIMKNPAESVFPQPLIDAFLRDPETPAFEFRSRPVSRRRVLDLVRGCAGHLRAAGLGPGDGVAVGTAVTPEGFAAQIAAHLLGCRVTGLRPGLTPPQLRHVLAQGVGVVIADEITTTAELSAAAKASSVAVLDLALLIDPAGEQPGWTGSDSSDAADVPRPGDGLTAHG